MSPFVYFFRRFLATIPTFIGITLVGFFVVHLAPGGPVEQQLQAMRFGQFGAPAEGGNDIGQAGVTQEVKEALRKQYGFDKPIYIRYFLWLKNILTMELGDSLILDEDIPVVDLIIEKFPVSLRFGIFSFLITYLVCIPLGVVKAIKDGSTFDFATSFIVFAGYAMPAILLAVLLIVLFGGGTFWDVFPISGMRSENWDELTLGGKIIDEIKHMAMPMTCYVMGNFAAMTLLMKNSMMDELKKEYVLTAYAKGLSERVIYFKHALRNALIPIATGFASILGIFLSGSFLIEYIFGLDGIGRLGYVAVIARDYPVVLGILVISSIVLLLSMILTDFIYMLIDPRINFSKSEAHGIQSVVPGTHRYLIVFQLLYSRLKQLIQFFPALFKNILRIRFRFHPATLAKWKRFRQRKSAWWSFCFITGAFILSLGAELFLNDDPLMIKYNGDYYFPLFKRYAPADFDVHDTFVVDYQNLVKNNPKVELAVFSIVPYGPFSIHDELEPPSAKHWLGTDQIGRDLLARLVYGFRISMVYALAVWLLTFFIGSVLGALQGFYGGKMDFLFQRITEIWTSIPGFYLLIILIAIFGQSLGLLIVLSSLFGWVGISYYMRAEFLKLRQRAFVHAAIAYGSSNTRVMFKHILPNALTPLITFTPFTISAGITGIAILDYLGLGLQPPTPSWGELMKQALDNFTIAWWISGAIITAMFITLLALVFINEGIRDAFDPKQ